MNQNYKENNRYALCAMKNSIAREKAWKNGNTFYSSCFLMTFLLSKIEFCLFQFKIYILYLLSNFDLSRRKLQFPKL